MDIQFYGANCIAVTYKGSRIVIDDNLAALGAKSVTKAEDVALFTGAHKESKTARLSFDGPGEYEVSDISVVGIPARPHMGESESPVATMFKLIAGDITVLVTGHIFPDLTAAELEEIGMIDIMLVPVGGHGYTTDAIGALKLIKEVEPKVIIPTHYADKDLKYEVPQEELSAALKDLGMEPRETTTKLKVKNTELSDVTQLVILEKS